MVEMKVEDEITLKDFVNVLCLRNQLINVDEKVLKDAYQNYDNYIAFLDSFIVLTQIDSAFLLYNDSFIEKIEDVISIHRHDKDNDPEVKKAINEIILYLNGVKGYKADYKMLLKQNYQTYHEDVRMATFEDSEAFIDALSYDAYVYAALVNDHMEKVERDDLFLSSINYLMETIPEMFDDAAVKDRAYKKINELCRGFNPLKHEIRKHSQEAKDNFKRLIKKGE